MAATSDERFTIDQLAQRTGMTVRNIRAHQSRGLLAPPEVEGRTGYYGADHVGRITLIRELQADGYSLDLIGRMLANADPGSSEDALRFAQVLRRPFVSEEPQIVSREELVERYGDLDPSLMRKAEEIGLFRPIGDGQWEELSPRLGQAARELQRAGVHPEKSLRAVSRLRRNTDSAARTFVRLFVEEIWGPFQRAGTPEDQWPEVSGTLERLRPLASDSLLALFAMAMDEEVEEAFGRELSRQRRSAKRRR